MKLMLISLTFGWTIKSAFAQLTTAQTESSSVKSGLITVP